MTIRKLFTFLSGLVFSIGAVHGQVPINSGVLSAETIFINLPDSSFNSLDICLPAGFHFTKETRRELTEGKIFTIDTTLELQPLLWHSDNAGRTFTINFNSCIYSTVMKMTWWNISDKELLVAMVIEQVDMCTERQQSFFYRYDGITMKNADALPPVFISEFISRKNLRKAKISFFEPAPVFVHWNPLSDTVTVSLEAGPYLNCADSYPDSPFIRLKEKQVCCKEIYFIRQGASFVRIKKSCPPK